MAFSFYTGNPEKSKEEKLKSIPSLKGDKSKEARNYRPDAGLIDAVNIALLLEKPLLVTGEPGTGKTQLAYNVALEFGLDKPLTFETKSTSTSRDLFYTYDSLTRFLMKPEGNPPPNSSMQSTDFINYNALGEAILRSNEEKAFAELLPADFVHGGRRRSVVLIDEIDKAPRDFPNDLLNEIENMFFKIPELHNARVTAQPDMLPIVIITSNSEKHLPDAFLRRCVFYNIPFPSTARLKEIVLKHLSFIETTENPFLNDALSFFEALREPSNGLVKKPSTAELLEWLKILKQNEARTDEPLHRQTDILAQSLSTIIKNAEDQTKSRTVLEEWLKKRDVSFKFDEWLKNRETPVVAAA